MIWVFRVLQPVLVHLFLSEASAFLPVSAAVRAALCAVCVLPFLRWMYREDLRASENSGEKRENIGVLPALGSLLGGGVLNLFWSGILNRLSIQSYFSNETQEALLSDTLFVQIFALGLLVPVAEELIFRGLVYGRMRERLSVWQAVLFSSVLFALYHGNPIQIIFSFPLALLLALLRERGGSAAFPILFHMGVNLTAVLWPS